MTSCHRGQMAEIWFVQISEDLGKNISSQSWFCTRVNCDCLKYYVIQQHYNFLSLELSSEDQTRTNTTWLKCLSRMCLSVLEVLKKINLSPQEIIFLIFNILTMPSISVTQVFLLLAFLQVTTSLPVGYYHLNQSRLWLRSHTYHFCLKLWNSKTSAIWIPPWLHLMLVSMWCFDCKKLQKQ